MQSCIIPEHMYTWERGRPHCSPGTFELDIHSVTRRKQWIGARVHISRTLFTRDPNVSVGYVCCDVDRTLKGFWEIENCGIERHDTDFRRRGERIFE